MSQRQITLTATITDVTGAAVPNAPCSVQLLFPGGGPGVDGDGKIVSAAARPFTADGSGVVSQTVDYPGDFGAAFAAARVRVVLNGLTIDSPRRIPLRILHRCRRLGDAAGHRGRVRMRVVYTDDSGAGIPGATVRVNLSQTAIAPDGSQVAASVPLQALTDASATAYFWLWPNSALNPPGTAYSEIAGSEGQAFAFTAPAARTIIAARTTRPPPTTPPPAPARGTW